MTFTLPKKWWKLKWTPDLGNCFAVYAPEHVSYRGQKHLPWTRLINRKSFIQLTLLLCSTLGALAWSNISIISSGIITAFPWCSVNRTVVTVYFQDSVKGSLSYLCTVEKWTLFSGMVMMQRSEGQASCRWHLSHDTDTSLIQTPLFVTTVEQWASEAHTTHIIFNSDSIFSHTCMIEH